MPREQKMYTSKRSIDGPSDPNIRPNDNGANMRPNGNGDIDHTASGRWRSRIRGMGEEKVVMEEVNAILNQLVQSYLVQQIERTSGQPKWKQVIRGG
jgi:hypothetical protein